MLQPDHFRREHAQEVRWERNVMDDTASLESVYQDFTRQLDRQSERVNALDAKANFGLGSGTLLAAVTGLQGGRA